MLIVHHIDALSALLVVCSHSVLEKSYHLHSNLFEEVYFDMPMPLIEGENPSKYKAQIIAPIISDADAIGTVILFSLDNNKKISNVEYKLVQSAASFLGKQMEP